MVSGEGRQGRGAGGQTYISTAFARVNGIVDIGGGGVWNQGRGVHGGREMGDPDARPETRAREWARVEEGIRAARLGSDRSKKHI